MVSPFFNCLMYTPWLSRWLEITVAPPLPGSLLSSWKTGPNARACPDVPESTIWSTSWRGIIKRKTGTPSKLLQGRWSSPVLIVLCQAYCKSGWKTRAFSSISKTLKPKYPPPNNRINARRRMGKLFKLFVFVFWKEKKSLGKEGLLVGETDSYLLRFPQNLY